MTTSTTPRTKPQPVLLAGAVITFCTVVFGGLATVAGLQSNPTVATIAGIGMLITGGANQALAYVVRGQVVPLADVAAFRTADGQLVAGPESPELTGAPVQQPRPELDPRELPPNVSSGGIPNAVDVAHSSDTKADAAYGNTTPNDGSRGGCE